MTEKRHHEIILPLLQERLQVYPEIGFHDIVHYYQYRKDSEDIRRAYVIAAPKTPSLDPTYLRYIRDEIAKDFHPSLVSIDYNLENPDDPEGFLRIGVFCFYEILHKVTEKTKVTKRVYDQDFAKLHDLKDEVNEEVSYQHSTGRNTYLGIFPHEAIASHYRDFLNAYISGEISRFTHHAGFTEMELSVSRITGIADSRVEIKYFNNPDLLQEELDYLKELNKRPLFPISP